LLLKKLHYNKKGKKNNLEERLNGKGLKCCILSNSARKFNKKTLGIVSFDKATRIKKEYTIQIYE
jgi:hypothetical protein